MLLEVRDCENIIEHLRHGESNGEISTEYRRYNSVVYTRDSKETNTEAWKHIC